MVFQLSDSSSAMPQVTVSVSNCALKTEFLPAPASSSSDDGSDDHFNSEDPPVGRSDSSDMSPCEARTSTSFTAHGVPKVPTRIRFRTSSAAKSYFSLALDAVIMQGTTCKSSFLRSFWRKLRRTVDPSSIIKNASSVYITNQ